MTTDAEESKFTLTVPQSLYDAVALHTNREFADSYLWGATLYDGKLTPRTYIAWERLKEKWGLTKLLDGIGISLVKPIPWGEKGGSELRWFQALGLEEDPKLTKKARHRPDFERF